MLRGSVGVGGGFGVQLSGADKLDGCDAHFVWCDEVLLLVVGDAGGVLWVSV